MRVVVGDEADIGKPGEQAFHCDARLHPREVQTHAGVLTGGKRDVRQALPENVELLGALPPLFIAVGRAYAHIDHRSGGKLDAFMMRPR